MADDPRKHSGPEQKPDDTSLPGNEDPLVELARIVSEDGSYYKSQRKDEPQQPEQPAAPEVAPNPVPAQQAEPEQDQFLASDLEQELMQELEQSFATNDETAPEPDRRSEPQPGAIHRGEPTHNRDQPDAGLSHQHQAPSEPEWNDDSFEAAFASQIRSDNEHQIADQLPVSPEMSAEQDAFSAQVEAELNRQYMERQRLEDERQREEQERQERELELQRQEQQRLEDERLQREMEAELVKQQEEEQRQREIELQLQEEQRREDERLQREFEQQRLEEEKRLRQEELKRIEEARLARERREQEEIAEAAALAAMAKEQAEAERQQSRSPYVNPPKLDQDGDQFDSGLDDAFRDQAYQDDHLTDQTVANAPSFEGHRAFPESTHVPSDTGSEQRHGDRDDRIVQSGLAAAATLGTPGIPHFEDNSTGGTLSGDAGLGNAGLANLGMGPVRTEPSFQPGGTLGTPLAGDALTAQRPGNLVHDNQPGQPGQPGQSGVPAELTSVDNAQDPADWDTEYDQAEDFVSDQDLDDEDFQDDDQFAAMPPPTVTRDYDVIPEEPEANPRSRKGLLAVAGVMAVVLIGAGAVAIMGTGGDSASDGNVPIIGASEEPLKETVTAEVQTDQNAGEAVFEANGSGGKSEERLINRAEEPRDVSRVTLPNSTGAGTSVGANNASGNGIDASISADTAGQSVAPQIDPVGPRRVRTVTVRPDGTIVNTAVDGTSQTLSPNGATQTAPTAPAQQAQQPQAGDTVTSGLNNNSLGQTPNVGGPVLPAGQAGQIVDQAGQVVDQTVDLAALNSANGLAATGLTASNAVPRSRPSSGPSAQQVALARQRRDIPIQDGPVRAAPPAPTDLLTGAGAPTGQVQQANAPGAAGRQVTTTRTDEPASVLNGYVVQVSSQRTEEQAREAAANFTTRYAELISGYQPIISRTNLGEQGTFYRVRIGVMPDQAEAIEFCRSLKAAGADCFVTR